MEFPTPSQPETYYENKPANSLSNVSAVLTEAHELTNFIEELADQLLGPRPTQESKNVGLAPASGVLGALSDQANYVHGRIDAARNSLNRIRDATL